MYLYLPIIDIQMKYTNYSADNEDFCLNPRTQSTTDLASLSIEPLKVKTGLEL